MPRVESSREVKDTVEPCEHSEAEAPPLHHVLFCGQDLCKTSSKPYDGYQHEVCSVFCYR